MRNLVLFLLMAFFLAFAVWARAEPTEPCARAEYLAGEVADGLQIIDELIEMARPVCAEKALARECARQRIEIRERIAEVKQLQAQQTKSAAQCKAQTATRKASAADPSTRSKS